MAPNCEVFDKIQDAISDIYNTHDKLKTIDIEDEVVFDIPSCYEIIEKANNIFKTEPAVLQINTNESENDFVIVGDIHGSLESLIKIFKERGNPKHTHYLFLGDYVDRGRNSCEVIILLYSLKCLYPNNIYLIRGNHEFVDLTDYYGFKDECYERVKESIIDTELFDGQTFYDRVTNSFKNLPICAILNNSIFCVHGGITSLIKNRKELLSLKKVGVTFSPSETAQAELLWNDPSDSIDGYGYSKRGFGSAFGKSALDEFLNSMEFDMVVRGHQSHVDGYNWPFGEFGGILTVFSSIDYCGFESEAGVAVVSGNKNGFEDGDEDDEIVKVHQIGKRSSEDGRRSFFKFILKIILFSIVVSMLA